MWYPWCYRFLLIFMYNRFEWSITSCSLFCINLQNCNDFWSLCWLYRKGSFIDIFCWQFRYKNSMLKHWLLKLDMEIDKKGGIKASIMKFTLALSVSFSSHSGKSNCVENISKFDAFSSLFLYSWFYAIFMPKTFASKEVKISQKKKSLTCLKSLPIPQILLIRMK